MSDAFLSDHGHAATGESCRMIGRYLTALLSCGVE
jgi:hypothetical protein